MWVAEYPPLLPKSQMALNVMAFTAVWLQTGKKNALQSWLMIIANLSLNNIKICVGLIGWYLQYFTISVS